MAKTKRVKYSIKRDDRVIVLTGKDKGKTGKVLKVLPARGRVIVERINIVKKAVRKNQYQEMPQGGFLEMEAPIHISNVMLVCPHCNTPTRVGRRIVDGKKVRYCKHCNENIV